MNVPTLYFIWYVHRYSPLATFSVPRTSPGESSHRSSAEDIGVPKYRSPSLTQDSFFHHHDHAYFLFLTGLGDNLGDISVGPCCQSDPFINNFMILNANSNIATKQPPQELILLTNAFVATQEAALSINPSSVHLWEDFILFESVHGWWLYLGGSVR